MIREVSDAGPQDADLIIVLPSPDFREEQTGRPLAGPAGYYLDRALRGAGVDRRRCLITYVVPTRPAQDVWSRHGEQMIYMGLQRLQRTCLCNLQARGLQGLGPPLLLSLGEEARQSLLHGNPNRKPERKQTVLETRGYPFHVALGGPQQQSTGPQTSLLSQQPSATLLMALATVHPSSFIAGGWLPFNPLFEWDVKKAARWLSGERPGPRAERVCRNLDDLQWLEAQCAQADRIAVDIEEKAVIAFAVSEELGVAVPSYLQEPQRSVVARILASDVPKITQNGAEGLYDHTRLSAYGFSPQNFAFDLMIMWHAIEPILAGKRKEEGGGRTEKSLRFFASLLTWEEFWKVYDFETQEQEYTLCAKDARITYEACTQLLRRMT